MKKRTLAIFTLVCLMATLFVVPCVQADYTNQWTDSIETTGGSIVYNSGSEYISNGDNGLFVSPSGTVSSGSLWSTHIRFAEYEGYDGGTALQLKCDTSKSGDKYREAALCTRGIVLKENTAAVLRYKIKFNSISESPANSYGDIMGLSLIEGGKKYMNVGDAALRVFTSTGFQTGKWYTVVTKVTGTTATKTSNYYVYDESGAIFKSGTTEVTVTIPNDTDAAKQPTYIMPVWIWQQEGINDLYVDDVSLTEVTTDNTQAISFDENSSDIKNGATGVALNKTFRLAFDHDLATVAADTVKLYKASDTKKASPISCTVSEKAFDSFLLTPESLELATEYVLDLSGVTSSAGAAISESSASVSFKTYDPNDVQPDPVTLVKASTADGDFTDGVYQNATLDDTFTLSFDGEILAPVYGTEVKLYNSADTTKTAIDASIALAEDAKSFTLVPTAKLSLGTSYTISFPGVISIYGGSLEGTKTISFTTIATRNSIYVQDDLETATVGQASYYKSDIIAASSSYVNIKDGVGYEDSRGILCDNSDSASSSVNVTTNNFELDASETIFFEYKFKIDSVVINNTDTSATNQAVYFMVSNASKTYPGANDTLFKIIKNEDSYPLTDRGQSEKLTYEANKWYTMLLKIGRTKQSGYIFDENGSVVLEQNYTNTMEDLVKFRYANVSSNKVVSKFYMDDFKVYRVQNDALALNNTYSGITDGKTEVSVTGSYSLVFNQPFVKNLKAAEVFALYEGENKVGASVKRIGGNEIRITPNESLKPGRRYTVKFAGAAAITGNALEKGEINFITMTIYDVNVLSTSLAEGTDGTLASGDVTLTVDNIGQSVSDAVVILAVYGEDRLSKLLGFEKANGVTLESGENTISVNISKNYSNVGYVELLMYDKTSTLKPLMKGFKVIR